MAVLVMYTVLTILSVIIGILALDSCSDTGNNCTFCGATNYPIEVAYRQSCMKTCGVCSDINVALDKPTKQSSTLYYGTINSNSSNAVDGNTDSDWFHGHCTHTTKNTSHWWCVDLKQIYNIDNIKVFNRNQLKFRLARFEIKTSSDDQCGGSGFSSATSCFKDTLPPNQDVYTINACNQGSSTSISARTIYVGVTTQYLTLCEVQIFAAQCTTGYYSTLHSTCQPCNTCLNDRCDPNTGVCTAGCKDIYHGDKCTTPCSDKCTNSRCSTTSSSSSPQCTDGCVDGYTGFYCQSTCPDNCVGGCGKIDGRCHDCTPDTVGPYCNLTCGKECQQRADQSAITCDKDGRCTDCIVGKTGDRCDMNCSTTCDGGCDRYSGKCVTCIKGKTGDKCNINCNDNCTVCNQNNINSCTECIDGKWGQSCNKQCNTNCKLVVGTTVGKCNRTTGLCSEGCKIGLYGTDCNKDCSSYCKDGLCYEISGDCTNGCLPGKIGSKCTKDCEAGKYGENCEIKCGNCAQNAPCDILDGSCGLDGCDDGFRGSRCQEKIVDGTSISPIAIGVIGVLCGMVGTVAFGLSYHFYKKRRQSSQSREENDPDNVYCNTDLNSTRSTTDDTLTPAYQNIPTNTRNVEYENQSFNTEDNNTRNMYDILDHTSDSVNNTYTTLDLN